MQSPQTNPLFETTTSDSENRAPSSETPSQSAAVSLESKLNAISEKVTQLHHKLTEDSGTISRDAMLKELHEQLQESRLGVHWKILRVVLSDLVKLYDDLARQSSMVDYDSKSAVPVLANLKQDVEDILYRQGFSPFQQEGDRFDPKRQQPVSVIESPVPELVGTIASRVAPGFASDDRILRPEKVVVYVAANSPAAV